MNIFAIGDLHLSFSTGPEKTMDIFGSAWVNHAERLKKNWERLVAPEDLVIVLGDLSWALRFEDLGPDMDFVQSLPGTKLLLKGNHDLWWTGMKKMKAAYPAVNFLYHDAFRGSGFTVVGTRGWICPEDMDFKESTDRKIYERELLRLKMSVAAAKALSAPGDRLIGAMHYPPSALADGKSAFSDIFKEAGVSTVVYGHLHGEKAFKNGPEGTIDGVAYHLCSLDRLNAVPLLIARV